MARQDESQKASGGILQPTYKKKIIYYHSFFGCGLHKPILFVSLHKPINF